MEIIRTPIVEFYEYSMESARERGFVWVMCLLAREADSESAYDLIQRYWNSLHDLTGDIILFVFAGLNREDNPSDSYLHHEQDCWRALYNPSLHIVGTQGLTIPGFKYPKYSPKQSAYHKMVETHTLSITKLRKFFNLTEKDIPALVFSPTDKIREGKHVVIKLNGTNIYELIKEIIESLEDPIKEYRKAREECNIVSVDLYEYEKKMEQAALSSKSHERFIRAKSYIESLINTTADSSLKMCLSDVLCGKHINNWGMLDHQTKAYINQYIDLLKNDPTLVNECKSKVIQLVQMQNEKRKLQQTYDEKLERVTFSYCTLKQIIENIGARSIDTGLTKPREQLSITVSGNNVQINTAFNGSTIHASQNYGVDFEHMEILIDAIRKTFSDLSSEDSKIASGSLEIIRNELTQPKPRKNFLKTAVTGLQAIKGTVEFGAAVIALIQFVQGCL